MYVYIYIYTATYIYIYIFPFFAFTIVNASKQMVVGYQLPLVRSINLHFQIAAPLASLPVHCVPVRL